MGEPVGQLLDCVIGQYGNGLVRTGVVADDRSSDQEGVVSDNAFEAFEVLARYLRDAVEGG